jgi:nucleoside-diphosphate-sugar epimerase
MPTALVTGASGFVGRHVVARVLAETDWSVVALSRRPDGGRGGRVRTVAHDLTEPLPRLGKVDWIIHLAGRADVSGSLSDPVGHFLANGLGAVRVLEFARHSGTRRVVLMGTDAVYGPGGAPEGTRSPWSPAAPYGASKCAAAAASIAWREAYGLSSWVLCPMNVFGEGQPPGRLIPAAARALSAGRPVPAFGGRQNWLYVGDLAAAVLAAVTAPGAGGVLPVASDDDLTAAEVVRRVAELLGVEARITRGGAESYPGQAADRRLDDAEFRGIARWAPTFGFRAGLARTVGSLRGS